MDNARFDELLRSFALGLSRRATIGAALSCLFASGPLALLHDDAEARRKRKRKRKKRKKKCKNGRKCGKKCVPLTGCCSSADCGANATCSGNACQCNDGFKECDGTCIASDVCCGGCPGELTCQAGACVCTGGEEICEIAEICCPTPIFEFEGATFCDTQQGPNALCTCPAGDEVCQGEENDQCCIPGDSCDPVALCVTDTCSAGNDFCRLEAAFCGDFCGCLTAGDDEHVCADLTPLFPLGCPQSSECAASEECDGGVCVNCCGDGEFIGICLDLCPEERVGRSTSRGRRANGRSKLELQSRR